MDKQELLATIEEVVWYEFNQMRDELLEEGLTIDVEATRDTVFDELTNDQLFMERLAKMGTLWAQEEYVHMVALDYFSSYEPEYRRIAHA